MGLLGLLVCPSAAAGQATITLSPVSAVVPLRKTQTFTAEVVGAPKIVYWSVCDANGKNCISGGNNKLGTIVDVGADANGNRLGRYEAPAAVPSPPACAPANPGCQLTVRAKLAAGKKKAFASVTVIIPPLTITTTSVPVAYRGQSYAVGVFAEGGNYSYTWTITEGSLPPGLTLTPYPTVALIGGTPTAAGTFDFTIQVEDSESPPQSDTRAYTLQVNVDLRTGTSDLDDSVRGRSYSELIDVSGGTAPFTWTEPTDFFDASGAGVLGTPCAGLALGFAGSLASLNVSGNPASSGMCGPFTIRASDSSAPPQAVSWPLHIRVAEPLVINTTSLPDGAQGLPYTVPLEVSGGIPAYLWSVSGLPDGLILWMNDAISGVPTVPGTFDITLQVRDFAFPPQIVQQAVSLALAPGLGRNDTIATATPLPNGGWLASISPFADPPETPGPDTDYYKITANAGNTVTVVISAEQISPDSPMDPVLEIVNAEGVRYTTCRNPGTDDGVTGAPDTTPTAFDDVCLNDDITLGELMDSKLEFQVPGPPGTPLTFYVHVLDFRGDARPDLRYRISVSGAN